MLHREGTGLISMRSERSQEPAIIFFDIDGTLVTHRADVPPGETVVFGVPSPGVVEAFRRLRERGHLAFICSGRPRRLVYPPVLELETAGSVLSAGACLMIGDEVVEDRFVDVGTLDRILEGFERERVSVMLEGTDECVTFMPEGSSDRLALPHATIARTVDEVHAVSTMRFSKFAFYNDEIPKFERVGDLLTEHFVRYDLGLGVSEMTLRDVDKGHGVRRVLETLGRDRARTFAFGDSENDLPLFSAVETSVAMGNAMPSVKGAAAYVTDSVADDGVVTGLEHFGLI